MLGWEMILIAARYILMPCKRKCFSQLLLLLTAFMLSQAADDEPWIVAFLRVFVGCGLPDKTVLVTWN